MAFLLIFVWCKKICRWKLKKKKLIIYCKQKIKPQTKPQQHTVKLKTHHTPSKYNAAVSVNNWMITSFIFQIFSLLASFSTVGSVIQFSFNGYLSFSSFQTMARIPPRLALNSGPIRTYPTIRVYSDIFLQFHAPSQEISIPSST